MPSVPISISIALALSLLIARTRSAKADADLIGTCYDVQAPRFPQNETAEWCRLEFNSCPDICGGSSACNPSTLEHSCVCMPPSNETYNIPGRPARSTNLTDYYDTVPGQVRWYCYRLCLQDAVQNCTCEGCPIQLSEAQGSRIVTLPWLVRKWVGEGLWGNLTALPTYTDAALLSAISDAGWVPASPTPSTDPGGGGLNGTQCAGTSGRCEEESMSLGAKIGVSVGAVSGVSIVSVGFLYFMLRRRRLAKARMKMESLHEPKMSDLEVADPYDDMLFRRAELPAGVDAAEMPTNPQELDGGDQPLRAEGPQRVSIRVEGMPVLPPLDMGPELRHEN
ncbi:hypothetical protein EJ04DRAFT_598981 [Polyplosphaeria fusca]|uniref:DUF7707 domain-containing protein n=1 Tax=Polyplosphaeria fusca TaxID=682080 RepID=A0A9P4QXV1_9PLEO|nr:hypothetical protein EJ04DRAFT_598981 [Polyplosphaeria fusca]